MKRMNLDSWAVGKLNQLFLKGSRTEAKFSKIKEKKKRKKVTCKTTFFVKGTHR